MQQLYLRFARGGHTGDVHEIAVTFSKKNCSHPATKLPPPTRLTDYAMSNGATHRVARREQSSTRAITLKALWMLIKDTFVQWLDDNPLQLAAALAYYTLFSIAPLLLIAIAVAGLVFGRDASQLQIIGVIEDFIGVRGAQAIQAIIESAGQRPDSGFFASVIAIIFLFLGAGGVVGQLQESLNTIWRVVPRTGRGVRGFLQDRLISYLMVLSVGFLLLVSLIISAALAVISGILGGFLTIDAATAYALDLAFSFAFNTLLFAAIYKLVPDVRIEWRDVWMGAAMTSLLFSAGKFLIAFYLGHSTTTSIYGAAGSVVTLLLWIYYSSLMFFFGAKLTQVYASRYGSKAISVDCSRSPKPGD